MIGFALLALVADIIGVGCYMTVFNQLVPPGGMLGNIDALTQAAVVAGLASSVLVIWALIAGLRREPGQKVIGAIFCCISLGLLGIQVVYSATSWIKYG